MTNVSITPVTALSSIGDEALARTRIDAQSAAGVRLQMIESMRYFSGANLVSVAFSQSGA
jgi:hypothetical protein